MPYSTKTENHFGNNDSLAGRATRQNTVYQRARTPRLREEEHRQLHVIQQP